MSTKVYDAYKFTGQLHELMPFLKEVREFIYNKAKETLIKGFKANYDTISIANIQKHCSNLIEKHQLFNNTIVVYFDNGSNKLERDARLSGILGEQATCNIYLQFFGNQTGAFLRPLGKNHSGIIMEGLPLIDYHYQNQVDTWYDMEGLKGEEYEKAEKEYKERDKTWNRIYQDYNLTPAQAGLSYNMSPKTFDISLDIYNELKRSEKSEEVNK